VSIGSGATGCRFESCCDRQHLHLQNNGFSPIR
jgi:hypothetical protein